MRYEEFPIPPAWQAHFECLWVLQAPPQEHVVYPDGRCELIRHLGVPPSRLQNGVWASQAPLLFAGQCQQALRLRSCEQLHCIGLRLRPAASACFWPFAKGGVQLQACKDEVVDASAWLQSEPALPGPVGHARDALLALAIGAVRQAPNSIAQQGCARLDELDGLLPVRALAADLGVSVRTLQQHFTQAVGLSPKEYARIRRLQATLRLLDGSEVALAQAALDAGFSDRSGTA